jgi:hypothetical protein
MIPEGPLPYLQEDPPLDPSLYQLNPVHKIASYLIKIHFNIILPFTTKSNKKWT